MPDPIKQVTLTEVQRRKWIDTRSALMWKCPAFTHILFSMLNPTGGDMAAIFTEEVPIAATDGSNLILNPERFFEFKIDERVFIVAHEIMHCILNHCSLSFPMRRSKEVRYIDGKIIPYDAKQMNIAMDLVINDILIKDKIGKFPECGVHDPAKVTYADSFLDAYRKIYEVDPPSNGKSGFDELLAPGTAQGKDAAQAVQDRSQTEWDTAVVAGLASARLQGKEAKALERLLSEIVEPTVTWQEHIRAFFARKVGSGGYNWRKPDRRLIVRDIFAPARAGNGCECIVVAVDTSGSIGNSELAVFFAEMRGILEDVRPRTLYVMWCDAKVHKVDEVEDSGEIDTLKPVGGGGTSFIPVFQKIEEMGLHPDALVYLTDGMGTFPAKAPSYPTLWGNIYDSAKYPWGDVVEVKLPKK